MDFHFIVRQATHFHQLPDLLRSGDFLVCSSTFSPGESCWRQFVAELKKSNIPSPSVNLRVILLITAAAPRTFGSGGALDLGGGGRVQDPGRGRGGGGALQG